jgi:hypothetical protein
MITIYNIIHFLLMIQRQPDAGIWINDYLNMNTDNGKLFQYCLDAKLIQTYKDNDSYGKHVETYAEVSELGDELVELLKAKDDVVTKFAILKHDALHGSANTRG